MRTRYPRTIDDAIVSMELTSEDAWLSKLFPGDGDAAPVGVILEVLGPKLADAVDKSLLRSWERQNGLLETTNCVKLVHCLKIQVLSTHDVNMIHLTDPSSTFVDSY